MFWLSGASQISASNRYSTSSDGTVTYTQSVYFVLKNSSFDIRDAGYQDVSTLSAAISDNNADISAILTDTPAGTYETLKYFNEWLTKNN